MQKLWDVLIIGAGPAGGLAALDCAKKGLRVMLVEQRSFPRWKVCGCCFNNQAQAILSSRGENTLIEDCGVRARRIRDDLHSPIQTVLWTLFD